MERRGPVSSCLCVRCLHHNPIQLLLLLNHNFSKNSLSLRAPSSAPKALVCEWYVRLVWLAGWQGREPSPHPRTRLSVGPGARSSEGWPGARQGPRGEGRGPLDPEHRPMPPLCPPHHPQSRDQDPAALQAPASGMGGHLQAHPDQEAVSGPRGVPVLGGLAWAPRATFLLREDEVSFQGPTHKLERGRGPASS